MTKPLIVILFIAFAGCSAVFKGCASAGKDLLSELDTAIKAPPRQIPGKTNAEDILSNHNFETPALREFLDDARFRQAHDVAIQECEKRDWREKVRVEAEAFDKGDASTLAFWNDRGTAWVKKIFTKELVAVGPFNVEARIIDADLALTIDTPCGTDRLLRPANEAIDEGFKSIVFSEAEKESRLKKLLVGHWKGLAERVQSDLKVIGVSDTEYKTDGTFQSDITLVAVFAPGGFTIFTVDVAVSGIWSVAIDQLNLQYEQAEITGSQDPLNLLDDAYRSSLLAIEGTTEENPIVFITSELAVLMDENGVTHKEVKQHP